MKLHNTLSRKVEGFKPLENNLVRIYSCGPTVYDHLHIGNLGAFIYVDVLRRALKAAGYEAKHVMNITDVDDKTIRRSQETHPGLPPKESLTKLTSKYRRIFLDDMASVGNDISALSLPSAVDNIPEMQKLITELYRNDMAYIADDGVYFSIEKYRQAGKKYGQLSEVSEASTADSRIQNDEYDKESAHDFALWKMRKDDEPAWEFELDGYDLAGRPGWHIECSAMSVAELGQPFDIHTGGVDLIFPHHENEIAQSTATSDKGFARFFVHNEHLLVEGKKMSKSLNNFYTLQDIIEHGFEPLAFRLLVLQSHYRSHANFSWDNLAAAQNRLKRWQNTAALRFQPTTAVDKGSAKVFTHAINALQDAITNDLDTPTSLTAIDGAFSGIETGLPTGSEPAFDKLLDAINKVLGIDLTVVGDLNDEQKALLNDRQRSRSQKDWDVSDKLRDKLARQGIGVRDTDNSQIWFRL